MQQNEMTGNGQKRIEWAERDMPVLRQVRERHLRLDASERGDDAGVVPGDGAQRGCHRVRDGDAAGRVGDEDDVRLAHPELLAKSLNDWD